MMFINAFVAAAVLAASAVTAVPSALPIDKEVASRTIQICRNKNLAFCDKDAEAPPASCVDLIPYNDIITSIDTGSLTCTFYSKHWCDLSGEYFDHTGVIEDLATYPGLEQWDNDISSYECQ
ncbi:uncharacterized protein L3040_001394 [Drepanopeziza brunnea f. sp. 'multigermtubi']|uniref:uncharacterized protein n=1 Tax=Drepanopeziza brunnea f. sp. 'multigermtubi' TaxID=698441 RepID=UPI0023A0B2E4|nr:hypothetical protein L3040_001394 [Drepanopeziza brunnea f. sp. 'multigermtubi']